MEKKITTNIKDVGTISGLSVFMNLSLSLWT